MADDKPLVLAVEDEPRNVALLEAILEPAGYVLVAVESLTAASTWLETSTPDVILLDRHLPDGDGLDLARRLKASPGTREIPVALVSASVLSADQAAATEAGCDAFIMKPLRVAALLAEVARLIAAGRARRLG